MLKIFQSTILSYGDKSVEEVLSLPGDMEGMREVAFERVAGIMRSMHDWPLSNHDWIVKSIAIAARLKSEFGVNPDPVLNRLLEFIRIKFSGIMALQDETIVLLAYLIDSKMVSCCVFLTYGRDELKALGKEEYMRRYIFGPAGVYDT